MRWNGLSVDVFTSHFVSYTNNPSSDNKKVRYLQSKETIEYIREEKQLDKFGDDLGVRFFILTKPLFSHFITNNFFESICEKIL